MIAQNYKSQQIKNSEIYWVVDIIESEISKQIEHRKNDITSLILKKTSRPAIEMKDTSNSAIMHIK